MEGCAWLSGGHSLFSNKSIDFSKGIRYVLTKVLILARAFAIFYKSIDFSKGIRIFLTKILILVRACFELPREKLGRLARRPKKL